MLILGLNPYEICSSATFLSNGKVVFSMCEERLSRIKRDKSFPIQSIQAGLQKLNISFSEIDAIAVGWNPIVEAIKVNGILPSRPRELYFYKLVEAFMSEHSQQSDDKDWSMIRTSGKSIPDIYFIRHHLAHASNSIFQSPYMEGDFLTLDFQGERETGMYGFFKDNKIEIKSISKQPRSTGGFYAAITQLLGYKHDSDEWKVMALSAAKSDPKLVNKYINVFKEATVGGTIAPLLKNEYFNTDSPREKFLTTNLLREKLDTPINIRDRNSADIREWQVNIATAMQSFISEYTQEELEKIAKTNSSKRESICFSGGFFMNCVFNGEMERSNLYKNVFISQSPGDLGNSIGSAMYLYHCILNNPRINNIDLKQSLFVGTKISPNISEKLNNYQISYKTFSDTKSLLSFIYNSLIKEKIIALASGESEFGERSLGARSIISLANHVKMKNIINEKIKYREDYRPFAPVCLQDNASKFFHVENSYYCEAMEKVVHVREEYRDKLAAITHFDSSARLQTIDNDSDSLLGQILKFMEDNKTLPVLINTSFNLNGEPNVESLEDCLRTFYTSGLDILVLENIIIEK
jgi:carbamoyltransferase